MQDGNPAVVADQVFTLTLGALTDTSTPYTLVLLKPVKHTMSGTEDDSPAFTVNVLVTDSDGSSAPASFTVVIDDDTLVGTITATAASVIHDETAGVDAGSKDQAGVLPVAFAGVPGTLIGWAQSAAAVVSATPSTGSDGGTATLSLEVVANAESGLDTLPGLNIRLLAVGDLIYGLVDADGNGTVVSTDPVGFAISLSAGSVLGIAQYLPIKHPTTTNPDDSVSLIVDALKAKVTVVDGDGDTATQTVSIGGRVVFEDDGPKLTSPDYAIVNNVAGLPFSFELDQDGTLSNNYGTDGAGTVRFPTSLETTPTGLTHNGAPITHDVSPNRPTA